MKDNLMFPCSFPICSAPSYLKGHFGFEFAWVLFCFNQQHSTNLFLYLPLPSLPRVAGRRAALRPAVGAVIRS